MKNDLVAVAMSGGVDSTMAAALLLEEGHPVIGVTMKTWREPPEKGQMPLLDPVDGARRAAQDLDIPHYVVDVTAMFKQHVVDPFIAEYSSGRTPNPCLYCNYHIKFGHLLRQAQNLGASRLATGHYARIRLGPDGQTWQLLKGKDRHKDQSYVLYMLGQKELAHVLFPLGQLTKDQVRKMAQDRQLPVAFAQESQDLCFIRGNDYRQFLLRYAPQTLAPGPILDSSGCELGQHKGLVGYTIGQRSGMGIAAPEALYVLRIDTEHNTLIVGPERELGRDRLIAEGVRWISGSPPNAPIAVQAKIRYKARPVQAIVAALPGARAEVRLAEPQRDITPGQGVVFYSRDADEPGSDNDLVLGGGLIAE